MFECGVPKCVFEANFLWMVVVVSQRVSNSGNPYLCAVSCNRELCNVTLLLDMDHFVEDC